MSEVAPQNAVESLTGLVLPLADRQLLVPNVALAELIPYRAPQTTENQPDWLLGRLAWRDLQLPMLSFEAASNGQAELGSGARVAVLNALGGRDNVKFIALVLQGIPRSMKIGADVPRADVELAPLELDAVQIGTEVLRIPDLVMLEQKLADAGLI